MRNNIKLVLMFIIVLFSLSCKKNIELINNNKNYQEIKINNAEKDKGLCNILLVELIKKSSMKSPFIDTFNLSIDKIENDQLTLRLFDKSNSQENIIGWLIFDASKKELLDITNGIDNPKKIQFDKNIWNQIIDCYFNTKEYYKIGIAASECKERFSDYESEEICYFKKTTINEVYQRTIKNKEVANTERLLTKLPKNDTILNINENGIISISYFIINPKKIEIEFLFEGGVNTLSLEQNDKKIKRVITTSAD